jgi:molybdenum cofactor synthesis domain-containing protein
VVVADEVEAIRAAIRDAAGAADLIVLTGGTGLGPRDVTPQAIAPLLDYEVPGMAEAMRAAGLRSTPRAMLSRQVVGVMGGRLVVALPGSPRAVVEGLAAIWDALPHALALLGGDTVHR